MSDLDNLLSADDGSTKKKEKSGSDTGLKIGIVISTILAVAGIAIAAVALVKSNDSEKGIKTNTDAIATANAEIKTNTADISNLKPVGQLYDTSTETLTVKNLNVEMINFTNGGTDALGAMSIAGRPEILNIISNVKDKGKRVIASFKYQPKVNPGGMFLAGGIIENSFLNKYECKPFDFC